MKNLKIHCKKKSNENENYSLADSSHLIKSHNFEEAKNKILEFSSNSCVSINFDEFKEEGGGLLWLGSHKVTGAEMNNYSLKLENYFKQINDTQIETIDQFKEVYDAFESLDKDYIQGIIISVKSAEKAAEDAKSAGYDAQRALSEIDKTVKDLSATQEKLTKTTAALEKTIIALSQFKSNLDEIKHLNDIDKMWKKLKEDPERISNKKINAAFFISIASLLIVICVALYFLGIL